MITDIALAAAPTLFMTLGMFLMYRVLGELDLSIDAIFTTGGAVTASLIISGTPPWLALLAAAVVGAGVGLLTVVLKQVLRVPYLLASLIVLTGFYSINLRLIGGATVGLIDARSVFDVVPGSGDQREILVLVALACVATGAVYLFLQTAFGLTLRAAGANAVMARSNGVDTRRTLLVGALIAGGLYALGGALQTEIQGFADITMGIGAVMICVAALFLGELAFPPTRRVAPGLMAVAAGSLAHSTILAVALRSGLPPTDLRLVTAIILILAVLLSRAKLESLPRAVFRSAKVGRPAQQPGAPQ